MQSPVMFQPQKNNRDKIRKIARKSKDDVNLRDLTEADLLALAALLRENSKVKYLRLTISSAETPFPGKALKEVFDAIQNNPKLEIKAINFPLCDNFGDIGAELFADFIRHNKTVIGADLTRTSIGNKGVAALAAALQVNHSMQSINVSWNEFNDQGLMSIIEMCKVNTTLEFCCLDKNLGMTDTGVKQLTEVMQTREKKIDFHISERHNISPAVVSQLEAACKSKAPRP